jgi:hypothetical protein
MARTREETREITRLRRRAGRLGFRVLSSQYRLDTIDNHGGYMIVNDRNIVVAGDRYDLSIEAVADWLAEEERAAA